MKNKWKKHSFEELFTISSGLSKSRDQFGFGFPFVTFKDVFYNYFLPIKLGDLANTSSKEQERGQILKGDIILTRTSETAHELGMSSVALKDYPQSTFNGFCKRLRIRPEKQHIYDPVFFGFYLRSKLFRNEISKYASITTRASLNIDAINRLQVFLPEKKEQEQIGDILKKLNDKIELNLQMNKTLEEMAMALYKHWFVDFGPFKDGRFVDSELGMIPEGWEVKTLDTLASIKGGKRLPKGSQLQKESNSHPYIRVRDFNSSYIIKEGLEYVPNESFERISKYIVNTDDVLLTIVGTIGKVALVGENLNFASLTENCVKVSPNKSYLSSELIFIWLSSFTGQQQIKTKTVGSTQPKLPIYNIKSLSIVLPNSLQIIKSFNSQMKLLFKDLNNNLTEISLITKLRDTLLPKLISGEVRLKEFKETIEQLL